MEEYDSDNDLDRVLNLDGDGEDDDELGNLGDGSGDEAIEDNSHNHEENRALPMANPNKPVKVKKPVLNPQPKLNLDTLRGPKGLLALNELFKDHKFKGNGHEKEDLGNLLKKLEQWLFRLFPKLHFEDSLKRLEALGKKREVQVYLRKIRNGALDDDVVQQVDDDEEFPPMSVDPFDQLLDQQISDLGLNITSSQQMSSQQASSRFDELLQQPDVTPPPAAPSLTAEQLARIERNRLMALEKKMKKNTEISVAGSSNDISTFEPLPSPVLAMDVEPGQDISLD